MIFVPIRLIPIPLNPAESPPPLPPPPPPLAEVWSHSALVGSTFTWQFNSYQTIVSGDRTKWFSINSLLFWIKGEVIARGVHLPIIKFPVHHSIHSPLFFRTIVRIEDSALRAAILDKSTPTPVPSVHVKPR